MSASARLLAAPRRREECLSAMTVLQTRAARRAGQSQLGPALCLQAQATDGPRISFSEALVDRAALAEQLLLTIAGYPRANAAARPILEELDVCRTRCGGLARKQPRCLRSDPEAYPRAEMRPLDFTTRTSSQSFGSRTHKDVNLTAAGRVADAAHRVTSRHRRESLAAAAGREGSPLVKRSSQGSLA